MFSSTSASLSKLNGVRVCVYVHMNECMCVLEECVCVCDLCVYDGFISADGVLVFV